MTARKVVSLAMAFCLAGGAFAACMLTFAHFVAGDHLGAARCAVLALVAGALSVLRFIDASGRP